MFSEFQANCCWSEASIPVNLRNWYLRWEKRWEERFWRRGGEGGAKEKVGMGMESQKKKPVDHGACGSHSITWDRKRGDVTLPIISHICAPPGRLNTISSLQRRSARERAGRTRESDEDDSEPGEMRHSFRDDKVVLKAKEVESHHMRYYHSYEWMLPTPSVIGIIWELLMRSICGQIQFSF